MADIAPGLNFRIGADVKGVQKAIREAEKSLRGAVSSFSSIGNSLSLAVSAPIAAFTGISLKAAGEMESLRLALEKTMGGAGRSIEEARMELEELRKAALAPGLDFQQAVKGSIRLQGVGYQAEEARRIITELANALTLAGGTADQLDGVTKQFTQMIGKGKIMQEDLTIILENMPNLAKVMQDTFGTSNAEMLRKMGVSVEDFISKLTDGMAKLPRAQGGIANAIVNAQNAIKLAIAEVGEEINKVFNVTGALQSFSDWVTKTAKWFRELDDSTKRAIGAVVVFAAALGPAFKIMQAGVFVVGKLQIAFLMMQKALALSVTEGGIPTLIGWWKKLDLVMKTSVIGATVAIVLALGAAWYATSKDMSAAAQAARKVEETRRAAMDSVSAEIAEIQALTNVAKDETKSKGERMAAMKKLIAISPEYQKALDGEKINTQALEKATSALVASLIRSANARKAAEDIAEIDSQMRRLAETSEPSLWQQAVNVFKAGANPFKIAAENAKTFSDNMAENKAVLLAQRGELVKYLESIVAANDGIESGTAATAGQTGAVKEAKTALDAYLDSIKANKQAQEQWNEARAAMGLSPLESLKLPALETPALSFTGLAASLKTGFSGIPDSIKAISGTITEAITPAQALVKALSMEVLTLGEAFDIVAQSMAENGTVFQQVAFGAVAAMQALADSGEGIENMGKAILGSLKKIIGGLIKTGVTAIVTKALLSSALNPFAAIALGAASGALAQALFNSLINKIKVPALAQGGVLTTPQLVLAGEYAGARANPEIISPESKMRDVFSEVMSKYGGGTQGGTLVARVSGDDLLFIVEKAERRAQRTR